MPQKITPNFEIWYPKGASHANIDEEGLTLSIVKRISNVEQFKCISYYDMWQIYTRLTSAPDFLQYCILTGI
jgi:hypothetical protein